MAIIDNEKVRRYFLDIEVPITRRKKKRKMDEKLAWRGQPLLAALHLS